MRGKRKSKEHPYVLTRSSTECALQYVCSFDWLCIVLILSLQMLMTLEIWHEKKYAFEFDAIDSFAHFSISLVLFQLFITFDFSLPIPLATINVDIYSKLNLNKTVSLCKLITLRTHKIEFNVKCLNASGQTEIYPFHNSLWQIFCLSLSPDQRIIHKLMCLKKRTHTNHNMLNINGINTSDVTTHAIFSLSFRCCFWSADMHY